MQNIDWSQIAEAVKELSVPSWTPPRAFSAAEADDMAGAQGAALQRSRAEEAPPVESRPADAAGRPQGADARPPASHVDPAPRTEQADEPPPAPEPSPEPSQEPVGAQIPQPAARVMPFPSAPDLGDPFADWSDETAEEPPRRAAPTAPPSEARSPARPASAASMPRAKRPAPLPAIPEVYSGAELPMAEGNQPSNMLSDFQTFDWD